MSSSQLGQAFQQIQSNGTAMRPIAGPPKNMPLPGNEGIVPPGQVAPPPLTLPNMGVDVGFRGGAISPYSPSPLKEIGMAHLLLDHITQGKPTGVAHRIIFVMISQVIHKQDHRLHLMSFSRETRIWLQGLAVRMLGNIYHL